MSTADWDIGVFAEALIGSGKDRIPYRFDKRRMSLLRRSYGLLIYPDGTYGLTEKAAERAISEWESVIRDIGGLRNPNPESVVRGQELQELVEKGRRWVTSHRDPAVHQLSFGDLPYIHYRALWTLVTDWKGEVWREAEGHGSKKDNAFWRGLATKGYVDIEARGSSYRITPTAKAKALVSEIGSPRTTLVANVVERFLAR